MSCTRSLSNIAMSGSLGRSFASSFPRVVVLVYSCCFLILGIEELSGCDGLVCVVEGVTFSVCGGCCVEMEALSDCNG